MNSAKKKVIIAIAEFMFVSLLALSVPLILSLDVLVIGHGVHEKSFTEVTQAALLGICVLRFGIGAWRRPQARGFLVLVAGFFACLFIREMDGLLDRLTFHGFWVWPATVVAVGSISYAMSCREAILPPMADFVGTRSHLSIVLGLVILLVFSRTFGSGNVLWKEVMGDRYQSLFKSALQEGLELLAYLFICYGAFLLPRDKERVRADMGGHEQELSSTPAARKDRIGTPMRVEQFDPVIARVNKLNPTVTIVTGDHSTPS